MSTMTVQDLFEQAQTARARSVELQSRVAGLTTALATNRTICYATGLFMCRYCIGSKEAFAMLVRISQNTNTKLVLIAADIVDKHEATCHARKGRR